MSAGVLAVFTETPSVLVMMSMNICVTSFDAGMSIGFSTAVNFGEESISRNTELLITSARPYRNQDDLPVRFQAIVGHFKGLPVVTSKFDHV